MTIPHMECTIRFTDEPEDCTYDVIIALTEDLGEYFEGDLDVFYYAGDYTETHIRSLYGEAAWRAGRSNCEWYIVDEGGAS